MKNFTENYHSCEEPDIEWEKGYRLGGLGEILERAGYCKYCRQFVREIWIYSCELVDEDKNLENKLKNES